MPVYEYGDVINATFPFQEGDEEKDRPVLVIVPDLPGSSLLVCMITKVFSRFDPSVEIAPEHFCSPSEGLDIYPSYIRPYRLFSIKNDPNQIRRRRGKLRSELVDPIRADLVKRLQKA